MSKEIEVIDFPGNKELSTETKNYLNKIDRKAQELHNLILEGGTNKTVQLALDRLQECVFWVKKYRLK